MGLLELHAESKEELIVATGEAGKETEDTGWEFGHRNRWMVREESKEWLATTGTVMVLCMMCDS